MIGRCPSDYLWILASIWHLFCVGHYQVHIGLVFVLFGVLCQILWAQSALIALWRYFVSFNTHIGLPSVLWWVKFAKGLKWHAFVFTLKFICFDIQRWRNESISGFWLAIHLWSWLHTVKRLFRFAQHILKSRRLILRLWSAFNLGELLLTVVRHVWNCFSSEVVIRLSQLIILNSLLIFDLNG